MKSNSDVWTSLTKPITDSSKINETAIAASYACLFHYTPHLELKLDFHDDDTVDILCVSGSFPFNVFLPPLSHFFLRFM